MASKVDQSFSQRHASKEANEQKNGYKNCLPCEYQYSVIAIMAITS